MAELWDPRETCMSAFLSFFLQHFHGLEEAVYRNIGACKELARVTRSSYGPNGVCVFVCLCVGICNMCAYVTLLCDGHIDCNSSI